MNHQRRLSIDDPIGSIVLGRYRIVRELAKGGMGVVYLARMEGAAGFVKPVVVKLVLPERAEDSRYLAMFVREAKILAQLRHPGIVDVLELGQGGGAYVMVLEYVRGYHLGQWMHYLTLQKRLIPVPIALLIATDVLDALHRAHITCYPDGSSMQIAHRDVSPSNIILDEERARLLDFGVARMRGPSADYRTETTGFVGKLTYGAPEMFGGTEATPQSDLYACAVVLHETLLGYNVFRGRTQTVTLERVLHHVPDRVEHRRVEAPQGLDAVLAKALAKRPEERHASALDFANELRALTATSEAEVRKQLASLLAADFGAEMATQLQIESLSERDAAWARLSSRPPRELRTSERENVEASDSAERARSSQPASSRAHALRPPYAQFVPDETTGEHTDTYASLYLANGAPTAALSPPLSPPEVSPESQRTEPTKAPRVARSEATPTAHAPELPSSSLLQASHAVTYAPSNGLPAKAARSPWLFAWASAVFAALLLVSVYLLSGQVAEKANQTRDLTRAMAAQQADLATCFEHHARTGPKPDVELDFELDSQGKVERLRVMPRELLNSKLGACLVNVGKAMRFPPSGQAVSFTLPIRGTGTAP